VYLHLGQETVVNTRDVVGLFDLDGSTLGARTREFLSAAEKAGGVVNVSGELPRSFVLDVPLHGRGQTVYISQLSAPTLKNRLRKEFCEVKR
jgi:hypothetical protein